MAGFKNFSDDSGPMADINITPFVDVMLVLLVIFMVTAPMLESGIPIQLPKASGKALPKGEAPVTLNISKDSKLFLEKEEIPFSLLNKKLQQFYKNKSNQEIYIRADSSLTYGFVAQVMATIKNAGINKIGLVTLPPGQ
ncbi:MAG: protein TolR [Proteobacteria bacterium]|nr:protein TolR [Pseudomonadota bacterium]